MAYVYRHIRIDKNVPFYIGISNENNNYSRANCSYPKHRNKHWLSIFNNTEIEVEILFDNIPYLVAKEKEIEFIDIYKRIADGGTLVNLTKGGDGVLGFKNPKLSERNRAGIWKGKNHTEESRKKISLSNIGKVISDKQRKKTSDLAKLRTADKNPNYRGKIYAYKNGNFVGEYESLLHTKESLNVSYSMISSCLTGKRSISKGFTFTRISNGKII